MKLITHKEYSNTVINGFSYEDIKKLGINANFNIYKDDLYNMDLYNTGCLECIPNFPFTVANEHEAQYVFPIKADPLVYLNKSKYNFRNNFVKNEFTFDIPAEVITDVRNNKCKIIVDYSTEPYNITHDPIISGVHFAILRTLEKYNLSKHDLILVQGNYVKYKINELPYMVCAKNVSINQIAPLEEIDRNRLHSLIANKTIRPKKIITLMRKPRQHKLILAEYLFKNNLLNDNIVTLATTYGNIENLPSEMLLTLPWQYDVYDDDNSVDIFSYPDYLKFQPGEIKGYEETYVNAAVESSMYPIESIMASYKTEHYYLELDFTEKTMKPIIAMQPFFVFGQTGILAKLKEQGYKTFDKWWDESYDLIPNYSVRMNTLLKLYKKLTKMPHAQLAEMMYEMLPIIEHNEQLYRDRRTTGAENLDLIETINKCFDK